MIHSIFRSRNHMVALQRVDFRWAERRHRGHLEAAASSGCNAGVARIRVVIKIGRGGRSVARYRRDDLWDLYTDDP